eukprot:2284475-Rhodomonas_salina.1
MVLQYRRWHSKRVARYSSRYLEMQQRRGELKISAGVAWGGSLRASLSSPPVSVSFALPNHRVACRSTRGTLDPHPMHCPVVT